MAKTGSLWIVWIHVYVLKGRNIWQIIGSQYNNWNWRKMLHLRILARKFMTMQNGEDVWKSHGSIYFVAHVWNELRPKREKVVWHRLVWTSFVLPKHAIIAWMTVCNRLPTKDRLKSWLLEIDGICVLCKEEESKDHMFSGCPFSRQIWHRILQLCGISREVLSWQEEA